MSLDATSKLGSVIGGLTNDQDTIKQNLSPDDSESQEQLVAFEQEVHQGSILVIQKNYPTDSFVIDHPVYGYIDSATLKLDGGYGGTLGGFSLPGTFPMSFTAGLASTELLFSATY